MPTNNTLVWFRRDLRLTDNPALSAAVERGQVTAVFIWAPEEEAPWQPGAASRWWLHHSLAALQGELAKLGSTLVIRDAQNSSSFAELQAVATETEATAVFWNRLYEPAVIARDKSIKTQLRAQGLTANSYNASLLFEPWTVSTQQDKPYRVYTPYWKNVVSGLEACPPYKLTKKLIPADKQPDSLPLAELQLLPKINWDSAFYKHWQPGSQAALQQLNDFSEISLDAYRVERDHPAIQGTSKLSPHLHFGEIGPRQIIHALKGQDSESATTFRKELVWREFAHHLLYHFPETTSQPLNAKFKDFPWRKPAYYANDLRAWQQGKTSIPIVDAGLRELWQTGWMHNRVRMIVGSLLTKNLQIPWQEGASWFWDTLVDADLAANTLGWQWIAGSGADAAPYFRIFNPLTQGERFDAKARYIKHWVKELANTEAKLIHQTKPDAIVDLKTSRTEALAAYASIK